MLGYEDFEKRNLAKALKRGKHPLTDEERHKMAIHNVLSQGQFRFNILIELANGKSMQVFGINADTPQEAIQKAAEIKVGLKPEEYNANSSRAKNTETGEVFVPAEH